jgi:hypothetical protein
MTETIFHRRMRAEGRCPRCQREHADINPHTRKPFWRCSFCRAEQASASKENYEPRKQGERLAVKCPLCPKMMRPGRSECAQCRYRLNGWKPLSVRDPKPKPQNVPKHVSTRVEVKHDGIAARLRWAYLR